MDISDERINYPLLKTLEPSDAYNDSPMWKRAVDKSETRLESKALQSTSKVHQTLRDMKQAVTRHHLLTFNDLLLLKWNIQTGLVACNTLEIMKQARTVVGLGILMSGVSHGLLSIIYFLEEIDTERA